VGVFAASSAAFVNVYLSCPGCPVALEVVSGSAVNLQGAFTSLGSQTIARVLPSSTLSVMPLSFLANPTFAQPPLLVETGATLSITPPGPGMALSTVGSAAEIVTVRGGQLVLEGAAATYLWQTSTNTPLVSVRSGGRVARIVASHLANGGPTPAHVVKCGANAIYNYQTSENDYAAVGSQNCACSR
jgi:hypothetical protein